MKTLVTGATGFIGSRLVEKLRERGAEVRCLAKDTMNVAALQNLGVEITMADLNNGISWERLLDGVDRVFHLAGATRASRTAEYYTENYLATKRLAEVCARYAPALDRFVYVSSQTAAGPSLDGKPVTEDLPCRPVSHYGRSKMMAEQAIRMLGDALPVAIVRPTAVYGPRDRDFCDLFKLARLGVQPVIGFRRKVMNVIYVDDLVEGILLAGEHPDAVGETYFLGNDDAYSTEEIGMAIAKTLNCSPRRIHLPHAAVYALGALAQAAGRLTGAKVFFNVQKVRESVQAAWVCSVAKARTELGFRARTPLDDGLRITYRWYREHGWLN